MKKAALIMAGGYGEQFWPQSRRKLPKQFLSLTDPQRTMIQITVDRISNLVDIQDVYVITNRAFHDIVKEQLPDLPDENILCEPVGRNTAPCIGLGAIHMKKKYGDAIMLVLPSDHLIKDNAEFEKKLILASQIAESEKNLVTLGINPITPETGYGYIETCKTDNNTDVCEVKRFVEKPDLETAKRYLESGNYLWNSGMFIWKVSTILDSFEKYLPAIYNGLQEIAAALSSPFAKETLERVFPSFESISIDYGIMEKTQHIMVIPSEFGWDDVGSWKAVGRHREHDDCDNASIGDVIMIDTNNTIVQGEKRMIACIGLKDLVIVDSGDAVLVCHQDRVGDIKKLLSKLKEEGRTEYL